MRSLSFLILLLAAALTAPAAADATARLLTASSGEHLWIVREASSDRAAHTADLLHHALDMGGPFAAATVPLHFRPEAIAAFGDRVWVVSPPRALTQGTARDVLTLNVRHRTEIDFYVTEPDGRFATLDTLPGDGKLASLAAGPNGPIALLRYDRSTSSTQAGAQRGSPTGDPRDAPGRAATYRLFEYRGSSWSPSSLPAHVRLGERSILAMDGPDLSRLNLLTASSENPARSLIYRRDAAGWSSQSISLDLDLRSIISVAQVRGRLAAVTAGRADAIELAYIRTGDLLPLAHIALDPDHRAWSIAGMNDGFRMIVQSGDDNGALLMRHIHWLTGELGPEAVLTRPGLPTARLLHMTIMLTIAVITVLLVLIVRPGSVRAAPAHLPGGVAKGTGNGRSGVRESDVFELPKGVAILSPVSRIIALLIDLAPGGVLALLIMRAPPVELLRMPIVTNSLDAAAPYLVMVGIMFVHVTLSEMMKGTSLGKALMGGRILSVAVDPPGPITAKQALIRNVLKLLILMIPPLAIFALLSRSLQGFNDILARTVVVGDLPEEEPATRADADEE